MSSSLRAAIAATALLALSSPSYAQSTPAEIADAETAKRAAAEPLAPAAVAVAVPEATPAAATVGLAPTTRVTPGARPFDSLIASHAASNGLPVELVHRVIIRESRYRADAMGRGGASGLMQIKLATARSMGYTGSAAGLLDPATNLTYGVRYLAGAYRAAGGHHARAVGYYASGYRGAAQPASAYARIKPEPSVFTTAATGEAVIVGAREVRRKKR